MKLNQSDTRMFSDYAERRSSFSVALALASTRDGSVPIGGVWTA